MCLDLSADEVFQRFATDTTLRQRGLAWLVAFSDSQGVIDWEVCQKILIDLQMNEGLLRLQVMEMVRKGDENDYALSRLDCWIEALTLAADHGCIAFS